MNRSNRNTAKGQVRARARPDDSQAAIPPALLDLLPSHIAVLDAKGKILHVNERWRQFARDNGADPATLSEGTNYLEACRRASGHDHMEAEQALRGLERVIEGAADQFKFDYACATARGERWFCMEVVNAAEFGGVLVIHTDITERRQAQEALRQSQERLLLLSTALESAINGVAITDREGRIQYVNPAFTRLTGYQPQEVIGHNPRMLKSGQHSPEFYRQMWQTILRGEPWSGEVTNRRKDGTQYVEEMTIAPVRNPEGAIVNFIAIKQDVTERRRSREQLERLVDERTRSLQEATDQLNTFVYTLAHDLRAPLRAQLAFASLLLDEYGEVLGVQGRDYAQRIAESAERQGLLLGDLLKHLSLSRADLPIETVELPRLIEQARADLALEIQQKDAVVQIGPVADQVQANASSLHLILLNLLSNALKFVAPGVRPQVRIWTELRQEWADSEGSQAAAPMVRLWVEDNGLGIPPELSGKLFGVFQRLHTGPRYPGTGIGLAIVKKAAERMGGRVGMEPAAPQGSRFWVELRSPRSPQQSQSVAPLAA